MIKPLVAALLLVAGNAAMADTVIFSDNFDLNGVGVNVEPAGWSVTDGTIDIVGPGFYDFIPGSGTYIDLDGSSSDAGILSQSLQLTAGTQYIATFDLAGNHRNASLETVTVNFGTSSADYSLGQNEGWTQFSLAFTATSNDLFSLSFSNAGFDNMGMLLDNVSVAAVPEPETYAMMLAGLALIGGMARRRKSA